MLKKNQITLSVRSLEKILLYSVLAVYQKTCGDLKNSDVYVSPEKW